MSGPTHFHFITVVWGAQYVETFLKTVVPNNLSPGNLPALRTRDRSVYVIATAPPDADRIRASAEYKRLSACMRTEVVAFDDIDFTQNKYAAMTECHRRTVRAAEGDGAAVVFLAPDAIWSDGSFARLEAIAATGKRLIAMCGLRVVRETFAPDLLAAHFRPADGTLTVGARDLVRLSLRHLHPICGQLFWDSPVFAGWPSLLFWRAGRDGILARCFHLHPLMVHSAHRGVVPEGTVDADYIWLACPDPGDVYVVGDSDEIFACDMSPAAQNICEFAPNTASVESVAAFARQQANEQHRRFLAHRIRLHAGIEPDALDWGAAEAASDATVDAILDLLAPPALIAPAPPAPEPELPAPPEPPVAVVVPVHGPGRWRFLSPRYLTRKLFEKGPREFLWVGVRKIRRRLGSGRRG
ncbi:hypothetical protein VT84_14555 [Gemmata sp. SH-PL17]|uniref:hypothetical protein n=1 Tax=Gemmata sp. SH-PL17 TaxID=1630693 RepID=UPI00078E8E8F|nr:hypothetical protein [Gemmata sp. SH-PL17]AMV25615.1 hypothetical protein VT84_14555 [Gemmata sp. SH-PL17]